jgi:hypothetical protein
MARQHVEHRIVQRLHHVELSDGHSMSLVACEDACYGLSFDGNLIIGLTWTKDELEQCVDVFENFVFMHGGAKENEEFPPVYEQ